MKKFFFVLLLLSFSSMSFATEFIFSTSLGYDNSNAVGNSFEQADSFAMGIGMGTVTQGGFMFYWDNTFSINETITADYNDVVTKYATTGLMWHTECLFGKTKKFLDDALYLSILAGLGGGYGHSRLNSIATYFQPVELIDQRYKYTSDTWYVGPSFKCNLDYYFTQNVGITIEAIDTIGFGVTTMDIKDSLGTDSEDGTAGIMNYLSLKFGAKFKF